MDKQKQIEEIAHLICGYRCNQVCTLDGYICNYDCVAYDYAKMAYQIGCRKIPENSVVLTKEEYDDLTLTKQSIFNMLDERDDKARKETAEKFAERLKESLDISVIGYSKSEVMSEIEDKIDEICKEIIRGEKNGKI